MLAELDFLCKGRNLQFCLETNFGFLPGVLFSFYLNGCVLSWLKLILNNYNNSKSQHGPGQHSL